VTRDEPISAFREKVTRSEIRSHYTFNETLVTMETSKQTIN